ncbi:tRNA (guanine(26)-N(2))-dimethyltransferase [Physcia stellaris]|nr:tRNA (guanine(26)-N(2))-dimethyltransferase [Physcia stellaris]
MASDSAARSITYGDKEYDVVSEGLAEILKLKKEGTTTTAKTQSVFYNPIQQFNRDLSVLAIRAFAEDLAVIRRLRKEKQIARQAQGVQQGRKRKRVGASTEGNNVEQTLDAAVKRSKPDDLDKPDPAPTLEETDQASVVRSEPAVTRDGESGNDAGLIPTGPKALTSPKSIPEPKPTFRVLDALSATGLRALRYAKEIPMVTSITANDLSSAAIASIKLNVQHNVVGEVVKPTTGDARAHMYNAASSPLQADQRLYQVIDLDPYGTAAPFFDAAVQALADGGLLCVTCTDAGVFASAGYLEKTYSQYGGLPFKGPQSHEGGLRLILHAVATSAARYGIAIEPLLSLSIDFYARLFIRIKKSPAEVKLLAGKTMVVYNCDTGCGAWTTQFLAHTKEKKAKNGDSFYKFSLAQAPSSTPHCAHCGFKTHLSGPMWGGPLHNPWYIQRILDMVPLLDKKIYATTPRIEGMLTLARDEAILDEPTSEPKSPKPDPPSNDPAESAEIQTTQPLQAFPSLPASNRANHPFFVIPSHLASIIHCTSPSDAGMRGALMHLGYRTSRSHTKPGSIVTDAPWNVIWEIMREYARQKAPIKDGSIKPGTAGRGIMSKAREKTDVNKAKETLTQVLNKAESVEDLKTELQAALYRLSNPQVAAEDGNTGNDNPLEPGTLTINFDEALGKERPGKKMVRYQANPRADWGPMNKASG